MAIWGIGAPAKQQGCCNKTSDSDQCGCCCLSVAAAIVLLPPLLLLVAAIAAAVAVATSGVCSISKWELKLVRLLANWSVCAIHYVYTVAVTMCVVNSIGTTTCNYNNNNCYNSNSCRIIRKMRPCLCVYPLSIWLPCVVSLKMSTRCLVERIKQWQQQQQHSTDHIHTYVCI